MLNTIEEAIEDLKKGKTIIVVDDENRENEGDLVALAEHDHARDHQFYGYIRARLDLYPYHGRTGRKIGFTCHGCK